MKTLTEFDQFLQTTVIQGQSDALGWDCNVRDVGIAAGPKTHVYVFDYLSGWIWMAAIHRAAFGEFAARGATLSPEDATVVRGAIVASALALQSGGSANIEKTERRLCYSVNLYAGKTKTYQTADRFVSGGHFCVILYRSKTDNSITEIRPFAIPSRDNEALDSGVFQSYLSSVLKHDRKNNPQWMG